MYRHGAGTSENADRQLGAAGFTLVELAVSMVVISILVVSLFGLFITLIHSATIARQRAVALTLATNQMEYLKSLPYDNLIVIGGSIGGTAYIPGSVTKTVNNVRYTVRTHVDYVDDAYDGCAKSFYTSTAQMVKLCRGSTVSTPQTDLSYWDYKDANVQVLNSNGTQLAVVDTQIAARVSETSSNTGALVITVVDGTGTPISGATVTAVNSTVTPTVNNSDTTDENGLAVIYRLPPDSGNDYVLTATKSGYSSLTTIAPTSLQPTYSNQKIIAQQASSLTMKLYPMTANSLEVETTDTAGNPLANIKVYLKGGYKKYTASTDTSYYDDRPLAVTSDASGLGAISNLVPTNGYIFCGDNGDTNCKSTAGTTYYLAAAVPYSGTDSLGPITIPIYDPSNPPTPVYTYSGTDYVQKVRLMLTSSASSPRVFTMNPDQASLSSSLSSVLITITGYNLSGATAKLMQGGTSYSGSSCSSTTTQLKCTYNLTGVTAGTAQLVVTNSAGTLTLPTTPLGGFNVNS